MSLDRYTDINTGSFIDEQRILRRELHASCGECHWNLRLARPQLLFADAEQCLIEHFEQVHGVTPDFAWSVRGECPDCHGEGFVELGAHLRERCGECGGLGRRPSAVAS